MDPGDRLAVIVGVLLELVGRRLLVAHERSVDDLDRTQPLDARHAVPARNEEPERETVLRLQRPAVHLVGQQDLGPAGVDDREAALVVLLDVALQAVIEAGEHHLARIVLETRRLQQRH